MGICTFNAELLQWHKQKVRWVEDEDCLTGGGGEGGLGSEDDQLSETEASVPPWEKPQAHQ